jgi:UDP-GlcNAc:undecaprenyl-phosphate GlcNAc-1-phosphate transferase
MDVRYMDLLPFAVAFGVTVLLILVLRPLAFRIGLVDVPGGRKDHAHDTPLVGGIALFCGFFFAVLLVDGALAPYKPLFAGGALLLIIGILDDFQELPAWTRFAAQITAALMMTQWGGVVVEDLGFLLGRDELVLGPWAVPFTVFGVVGVINAFNMCDGLDGLAGTLSLLALVFMALAAFAAGDGAHTSLLMILAAAVLGFLVFNYRVPGRRRALVFLGDAGSMFLGFCLAWFLVALTQAPNAPIAPVTALWLVAIPLLDTVSLMLRRVMKGRSPFAPDREHFHHILLVAGYSVSRAVLVIAVLSTLLALFGLAGLWSSVDQWVMFYAFAGLFLLYFWGVRHAWRVMRVLPKPGGRQAMGAGQAHGALVQREVE